MKVGEHVAFSSQFIKSTDAHNLASLRGFVIDVDGMIAKVHWVTGNGPMHVLVKNLMLSNDVHKELT